MSDVATLIEKASLALEDLLKPDGKVLYENVFSTRHIGRIIDFFLYEGRSFVESSPDSGYTEYRIRNILELSIFNGWSNYRKGEKSKCIELECGWDTQRFIVGASFYASADIGGFAPGQKEKPKNAVSARMLKMFLQIQALSDGVIVRHEAQGGRVQILAFVSAKDGEKITEPRYVSMEHIELGSQAPQNESIAPVPLSASGVDGFIADEKADERKRPSQQTAATVPLAPLPPLPDSPVVEATDQEMRFGASAKEKDKVFKIKSGATDSGSDVFVVKSKTGTSLAEDSFKSVPGGIPEITPENTEDGDALDTEHTEESIQVLLGTVKTDVMPLCVGLSDTQFQEAFRNLSEKVRENYTQTLHHLMRVKNIQMISKMKNYKDQISVLNGKVELLQGELGASKAAVPVEVVSDVASEVATQTPAAPSETSQAMADLESAVARGDVPLGAQEWAKSVLHSVSQERGEMNKKTREWESKLRKTEYDFKSKETALREQNRIKEEQLRQKDFSLKKTKEALSNSLGILEKNRTAMSSGTANKAELGNKLATAERLLSIAKENNERMQKRLEDVQKKWHEEFNGRANLQKECSTLKRKFDDLTRKMAEVGQSINGQDPTKIVADRDRANKMIEELKRQNKELQDKLTASIAAAKAAAATTVDNSSKRGHTNGPSDGELKHRLEHANKLTKSTKEDLDRFKKKYDDLKLEETKLRVEIGKLQSQLKIAVKTGNVPNANKPKLRTGGGGHIPPKPGTGTK